MKFFIKQPFSCLNQTVVLKTNSSKKLQVTA